MLASAYFSPKDGGAGPTPTASGTKVALRTSEFRLKGEDGIFRVFDFTATAQRNDSDASIRRW